MEFTITRQMLQNVTASKGAEPPSGALFLREESAFSGVNKIARKVIHDMELVFGAAPQATTDRKKLGKVAVLYGTVGHSPMLRELEEQQRIDLTEIRGKREVFLFQIVAHPFDGVEQALVIAGSDKRGTIYGLFHLSERLGVSPLVDWANVKPAPMESFSLSGELKHVSKEPSVRFRGFFINDEWPAFGNWATNRFGGFQAQMYDHVFELLLRLKGNYLWPAMWSARFYDDGPGLANAELADEYGVVMGASHHEPCLRYGEEYRYLRGKDSIYGDAWNFIANQEGITRFWEDGLKRSGHFESVITVGMRGEADTAIMGKEAALADNIALLREVLQTQNRLIREHVNPDLTEVPRMLALYKEVEPFFYGDEHTPGLIGSQELEDVILMLCDDNHGNLRTLPTEEMRSHPGGYGMYYHFDYHGGPISYEWINSSYLPKIGEQMTMAYDFGIRDLWIVNVGDIATQEFPLSYFLDLAYDFDKWGTAARNQTDAYTQQWIQRQFAGVFSERQQEQIFELLTGYTRIAHKRRPEHMNANVYHPVNDKETDELLKQIDHLLELAEELYKTVEEVHLPAYYALVYYPAVGNLNLQKMWLLTGKNHYLAKLGALEANKLAEQVEACLNRDRELVAQFHAIDHGRWYGMGLSEHIGFTRWNEDEAQNPVLMKVLPVNKPRLLVTVDGTTQRSEGCPWHINKLELNDFLRPDVEEASFTLSSLSELPAEYTITCSHPWLTCSRTSGVLDGKEHTAEIIRVKVDRRALKDGAEGHIAIHLPLGVCTLIVNVPKQDYSHLPAMTFIETSGYVSIEAEHFARTQEAVKPNGGVSRFEVIEGYGKTLSAVKAYPTTDYFTAGEDAPYVEYNFAVQENGIYELELYLQPSNPVTQEAKLYCGVQLNEEEIRVVNTLPEGYRVDGPDWAQGVLSHIRKRRIQVNGRAGLNTLRIYAVSPGFVLEKIVIHPEGKQPADSYLGPVESYYTGKTEKLA
ncbi:glycosyl hydrolase 115 family protein [Gorillibacterium sp. sgz500922]|uniref:glycosyl hydrolase 115 family protein n=1 Tax=Gorillibacterium sp. sgz500922 TaxID=3446694 RepID=UPI003F67D82A